MFPEFDSVVGSVTDPTSATKALAPLYSRYICLEQIVDSNFDANVASAWVIYLSEAITLRSGYWIPEFKALYDSAIKPSLDYLNAVNVPHIPYNLFEPTVEVPEANHIDPSLVGGETVAYTNNVWTQTDFYPTGVCDPDNPTQILVAKKAPAELPLLSLIQNSVDQETLLWKLSWLEAGLLGYHRSNRWDAYADPAFLSAITQTDLDYRITAISTTTTSILLSSDGKASYPPIITVPVSILDAVNAAIAKGATDIEANTSWRTSTQYRYIYDQFAQQHEIDRYSQFWREWAMNFALLLKAGKVTPYAVSYWQEIDSACSPLGDGQANYLYLKYDAENRSSSWVPGDGLPSVPVNNTPQTPPNPTDETNGWDGNTINDSQFLLRPDIKDQPIPVQMAMLDLNKCYSSLQTRLSDVTNVINTQISSAQATVDELPVMMGMAADSTITQIVSSTPSRFIFNEVTMDVGPTNQAVWASAGSITVPVTGDYMILGSFPFGADTLPSIKKTEVFVAGISTISASSNLTLDPISVSINQYLSLTAGQTVEFRLSCPNSITLNPGSSISVMATDSSNATSSTALSGPTYPCGASSIAPLTAVVLDKDGYLQKVLPSSTLPPSNSPLGWLTGVTLTGGNLNDSISVVLNYGAVSTIPNSFDSGSLIYVDVDGSLTTTPPIIPVDDYVIVVGEALTENSFIYQPQLPIKKA